MAFEKFKNGIKNMSLDDLNREIQERKRLLFNWNRPVERQVEIVGQDKKIRSKHPFKKIRKELAILNTIVHQRLIKCQQ